MFVVNVFLVHEFASTTCRWAVIISHYSIITSDMQGLVWGEPELAYEYDFDVENIEV